MANPQNISSYDPRLVMLIEQIASSDEPRRVPMKLGSRSAAISFGSRFSTLKGLIAKRAIQNNSYSLAERVRGCCLRALDKEPDEEGKLRPTGWYICNATGGQDRTLSSALDAALAELRKEESDEAIQPAQSREIPADVRHQQIAARQAASFEASEDGALANLYGAPKFTDDDKASPEDIAAAREYEEQVAREEAEEAAQIEQEKKAAAKQRAKEIRESKQ